jgi:YHS domain-containing protein
MPGKPDWLDYRVVRPYDEGGKIMMAQFRTAIRVMAVAVVILAIGIAAGCGSKDTATTEDTSAKTTTLGRTVQKAKENKAALEAAKAVMDPVCGMAVEGGVIVSYKEMEYHFCSQNCADKFNEHPEKYVTASANP